MSKAEGFTWTQRSSGDVVILHHGQTAATLRGRQARDFMDDVSGLDTAAAQDAMARLTGNYKRGNERQARNHPRNRGRR